MQRLFKSSVQCILISVDAREAVHRETVMLDTTILEDSDPFADVKGYRRTNLFYRKLLSIYCSTCHLENKSQGLLTCARTTQIVAVATIQE